MKGFWKVVLGTIVGLILFIGLQFVLLLIVAGAASSSSTTSLSNHSVYRLDLKGTLAERVLEDPFSQVFGSMQSIPGYEQKEQIGLQDVLANIKLAKEDSHIEGIYLKGGQLSMGFASAKQIRDALLDFKQSGKWIVAYADSYSQSNYYLASVADKICLNSDGAVSWSGLASAIGFYKGVFDKLGVEIQVFKVGTFKSAVEPYINTEMSDANKLQMNTILDDIWSEMKQAVALSRNLTVGQLDSLADMNMDLQPQELYVQNKLVDTLVYVQDIDTLFKQLTGTDDFNIVSHKSMNNVPRNEKYKSDHVAVIYAEGTITDDTGDGIVGKKMVKTINEIAEDDDVKAVVLRVNSGGGSAYASEQIWHAMTLLKQKGLPVIVSMGDYAASGGYYISCMADSIFAEPTTITGSIGIFGLLPNVHGLAQNIGYSVDGVQTNKHGLFNVNAMYGIMPEDEKQQMQAAVNRGYEQFTLRCANGRGLSQDSIKVIGEGRVWSGKRALELGLVDRLASLDDAICAAASMAGVTDYTISSYPEQEDIYTQLLNSNTSERIADRIIAKRLGYAYDEYKVLNQIINSTGIRAEMIPVRIY